MHSWRKPRAWSRGWTPPWQLCRPTWRAQGGCWPSGSATFCLSARRGGSTLQMSWRQQRETCWPLGMLLWQRGGGSWGACWQPALRHWGQTREAPPGARMLGGCLESWLMGWPGRWWRRQTTCMPRWGPSACSSSCAAVCVCGVRVCGGEGVNDKTRSGRRQGSASAGLARGLSSSPGCPPPPPSPAHAQIDAETLARGDGAPLLEVQIELGPGGVAWAPALAEVHALAPTTSTTTTTTTTTSSSGGSPACTSLEGLVGGWLGGFVAVGELVPRLDGEPGERKKKERGREGVGGRAVQSAFTSCAPKRVHAPRCSLTPHPPTHPPSHPPTHPPHTPHPPPFAPLCPANRTCTRTGCSSA